MMTGGEFRGRESTLRGGWVSVGASSGSLVQLLVSQTLGHPDAVMVTLLGLSLAGFLL